VLTTVVIPTFKNHESLWRAVHLLEEHTDSEYELLIIDQGFARGYVAAANQGLRAATGDLLVVLTDDCLPQPGWLSPMVKAAQEGVWLMGPDWRAARLGGHCLGLTRECWVATGGFDGRFRHYCADHDLELRVTDHGKPVRQVTDSHVTHDTDGEARIYNRVSRHTGNWRELPNVGQWYLDDMQTYTEIWGGRVPHELPGYKDGWCE